MYRIVVADDEVIERKVLSKRLRQHYGEEVEIYEAENGREVLALHEKHHGEIFILDIEMPGITGLEAAEEIRRKTPEAVIIFLTAFDEFSYARKAITVHALDYLLKPCDEEELMLVVDAGMLQVEQAEEMRRRGFRESARGEAANAAGGEREDTAVTGAEEPAPEQETGSPASLKAVITSYIEDNFMQDLSVQDIAGELNYSEPYFCRLFKQLFNKSFISYLTEFRIEKARKELANVSVNIKDIGKAVGYPDSNYFAKVFKRITGESPSDYRARILR